MEELSHKEKVTIMIAIMATLLFVALNQTIIGTALPIIIADIGGVDYYSWVFTIFMLASSVTAILVGKLSDMYGRKPFILTGIAVFMLGSFLCGTSDHIVQLILYRGLQGFGGGMVMSTAFASVGDLFPPRQRGRWQGIMSAVFGLASVFGPTVGGYIADQWKWQWVFWVFLPAGIAAFVCIWKMFPWIRSSQKQAIDYAGSLLLALTVVPLLLAFSLAGTNHAWDSIPILGLFVFTVLALSLFLFNETRAANPVLPLSLFKNDIFTFSNIIGFLMGTGMFGAIMYMPFFIQGVMGVSATLTGFMMMVMTLSMTAASTAGGHLITKTGKYKGMAYLGLLVMAAGMFSMSQMSVDTGMALAAVNLFLVGFGLGLCFPVFTLTVQNAVSHQNLGVATASTQLFRQLGGTIGVSIMGVIMNQVVRSRMEAGTGTGAIEGQAASAGLPADVLARLDVQHLSDQHELAQIRAGLSGDALAAFDQLHAQLQQVLSHSLNAAFLFGAGALLLAIALHYFLREIPLRTTNKEGSAKSEAAPSESTAALSSSEAESVSVSKK